MHMAVDVLLGILGMLRRVLQRESVHNFCVVAVAPAVQQYKRGPCKYFDIE